ncbi:unnamed protein product [Heligmosomoides polygyrus]|uniref:Histone H1 n=1 Tax=Heligmosomoides polygyrus TaxID=6339 RepID=A0A183FMJ6_HELPZ|nr:unnamed protein product [Heligmosomoides polygyrus]
MDNIDEEYDRFAHHLRDSAKGAEGLNTIKRRLSPDILKLIRQRGVARTSGNYQLTTELAKPCRAAIKEEFKERRAEVLAAAAEAGLSMRTRNVVLHVEGFELFVVVVGCWGIYDEYSQSWHGAIFSRRRPIRIVRDSYESMFMAKFVLTRTPTPPTSLLSHVPRNTSSPES